MERRWRGSKTPRVLGMRVEVSGFRQAPYAVFLRRYLPSVSRSSDLSLRLFTHEDDKHVYYLFQ